MNATDKAEYEQRSHFEAGQGEFRRLLRYLTAAGAAVTALVYFLIGFHILTVLEDPEGQFFGIFAGIAYGLGAFLLLRFDRRLLWFLGAILQVFVIVTYFGAASQRIPAFEIWGILLRIVQLALLIGLAYLALRPPTKQSEMSLVND